MTFTKIDLMVIFQLLIAALLVLSELKRRCRSQQSGHYQGYQSLSLSFLLSFRIQIHHLLQDAVFGHSAAHFQRGEYAYS